MHSNSVVYLIIDPADYNPLLSHEVVITRPSSGSTYCAGIDINDDILVEGDELFLVSVMSSDPAVELLASEVQVTIMDDDRK